MLTVALTGNVASGKTTVAEIWAREGVPLIRADDLAREVVAPGTEGLKRVVRAFGEELLRPDGLLDRAKLRALVFRDAAERKRLEGILHPLIEMRRREWLAKLELEGASLVVAEIPLLFEVGLERAFDGVVLVTAPAEECLRRLVEDRGLDGVEAARIMSAQMPVEEKLQKSDYVLENEGTREELESRALALLDLLRARARNGERE
jgi:dephospho-CoA kinase